MNKNNYCGKIGENIAKNYLIKNGYIIKSLNHRIGYYEIDIIASFNTYIVFIEVKTRLSNAFGLAEEQLMRKKIIRLQRAINRYFLINSSSNIKVRADFIAINLKISEKLANIKHFINII